MKILNKLTQKHLLLNKKRTIVTIIGILLSTALMCGIGLLVSSFREYSIKEVISSSGDYFAAIKNFPVEKLEEIKKNEKISNYYMKAITSYFPVREATEDRYGTYAKMMKADQNYLDTLLLKEGTYPTKANELILTENSAQALKIKVGDTISLPIGSLYTEEEPFKDTGYIPYDVTFQEENTIEYKVVGILQKNQLLYEKWYDQGYGFTIHNTEGPTTLYIKTQKAKDIFNVTKQIEGIDDSISTSYNNSLLSYYGVSKYSNVMSTMTKVIAIILGLISVGCIIVIYNSFAISVMERKKQFGLFSSIGATKGQLRYTVFYEALLVGTIGILLGILSSFLGIGVVLYIINHLIGDLFEASLELSVYPIFLFIPILFMVITVFISAYLPAYQASRVSPIVAIRGNDDIKVNKRKIKTRKWIRKLFHMEGEIALKNIKRNKRKYRITIISLVVSIVLFISFSSLLDKMLGIDSFVTGVNFDISLSYSEASENPKGYEKAHANLEKLIQMDEVKESTIYYNNNLYYTNREQQYTEEYEEYRRNTQTVYDNSNFETFLKTHPSLIVTVLAEKDYQNVKKMNNIKEDVPLLVNYFEGVLYKDGSRSLVSGKKTNEKITSIPLCDVSKAVTSSENANDYDYSKVVCGKVSIDHIEMITKMPLGNIESTETTIYVNQKLYDEIYHSLYGDQLGWFGVNKDLNMDKSYRVYLKVDGYDAIDEWVNNLVDNDLYHEYFYQNILKEMKQTMNLVFVIKILFYGFITLVTLIGVTSVFNTLNTSISLRKKEFAMLRSMGLTPGGFNRMILFESIFFGIKSLCIGIPVSLVFVYLIGKATDSISNSGFVIPVIPILITIVAVFVIVLLTMIYATSKIRHDNILEAIREENI